MKKFLLFFALILPLGVFSQDIVTFEGITEPEWKDFAPPSFANVSEPKGIGKLNETAAYWYKRRMEFENSISNCHAIENLDAQLSCFQEVKVKQYQENSDYNARIEAMERARMCPQEIYDKTNNMLPIGGYLNNFSRFQPNELR